MELFFNFVYVNKVCFLVNTLLHLVPVCFSEPKANVSTKDVDL